MQKKSSYTVVLTILGNQWKQTGETIEEALSKFPLTWNEIKGKGTLTVSGNGQKHEHLMSMKVIRRVFSNKIARAIWAKNLTYLLK